ncbi:hypothetical protein P153DRAFT_352932 [Dothidotthia symphoricarpi CBS 119687]|uniref:Zn(2)-C6 fungal-type domain-containing protein n=1 Tax=Dothidotthia symphoricarpi CBS 119687 TaxID=1392245 RepID=A0A6A6AVQ4_9PLEO|nr:uncharacterized protein P153DRAFT_352932 [Dothidotthia symphoricarpi CBS 119687]KAF2135045.1 hypothetical protein P153DRAFT_352932 [Dothidotthia symphoricarpi CBS 119687]
MSAEPPRKRAKLACVTCNARRVKCDVTDRQPCSNCAAAGDVVCETRESKRGKHPRKPKVRVEERDVNSQTASTTPERHADEVAASHVLASLSSNFHSPADTHNTAHTNEYSFATPAGQTEFHGTLSKTETPRSEDDTAVFLGESSSLRYVTDEQTPVPRPNRPRLRHAVPNAVKADALVPQWEAERRRARMEALQAEGTFSFPPNPVRMELLKAYFEWFHPHFAILDETDFWASHQGGNASPLLLQAMLFIGVIHCEESTITTLGWGNRHRAKWLFYIRAKDIYDATYETNKITVIQALFLMSFWRAGALLEKDARHWLGTAISLAQTRAFHRSASESQEQLAKLKRRIWWAIYVRERQCGSALGLPNRIRDKDCDVEPLSAPDFASAYSPSTSTEDVHRYIAYSIGIMQLAIFIGKIVDAGYLPNRTPRSTDRAQIRDQLYKWKQDLPSVMLLGDQPSFQANMLHLAYNNLLILLYRTSFVTTEENNSAGTENDGNIALQAAARNSRIVEDMLPSGNIGHAQMHVITNLFNTLCIHVAHLRNSTGINRTLAEHRAKLCLLGLQELQKTWEVTNWVLQMFFQYLDRSTAARLAMEADDVGISSAASQGAIVVPPLIHVAHQAVPDDANAGVELPGVQNDPDTSEMIQTPWSWTTDEANQYIFSQIENDFAFGEGGLLRWSPGEVLHSGSLTDFGYIGLDAED